MKSPATHYDNLFVLHKAPIEVLRSAYRALAQKYHPDRNKHPDAERIMKMINEAWSTLGDPVRRREYDTSLLDSMIPEKAPSPGAGNERNKTNPKEANSSSNRSGEAVQTELLNKLRPLAGRLWIARSTRRYIHDYLQAQGLNTENAEALVSEVFG